MSGDQGPAVLLVGSHRAGKYLRRVLGYKPQYHYDNELKRGGVFVVLSGEELEAALEIKSIRRTRLKVDDVSRCISHFDDDR
jgi:hypothetical protein